MKKLLTIVPALFVAGILLAQPGPKGQRHSPGERRHHAMQALNLTPEQQADMKQLNQKLQADMKALNAREDITVKSQRDQREALVKAHRQAMDKVLTPEQRAKRDAMKQQAKAKMAQRADDQLAVMQNRLQLTSEQVASIKASRSKTLKAMEALRQNDKLDRTARHEAMEKLHEQQKATMQKILTPEQWQQWQQQMPRKPAGGRGGPEGPRPMHYGHMGR